jgi:SAM-dependent methyltransferase
MGMASLLNSFKILVVGLLYLARLGVRPSFFPGTDLLGRNIYYMSRFRFRPTRASADTPIGLGAWGLLDEVVKVTGESVLDVGAGSLKHSSFFADRGKAVTAIDLGTSVYASGDEALENSIKNIEVVKADFNYFVSDVMFDLVWASHVLEHQGNAAEFIRKCLGHTKESGFLVMVLPFPHREIWGGHLSYWTPGTLAYNLVLAGTSMLESSAFESHGEFVVIVRKRTIDLSQIYLSFDSGDVQKLSAFLPPCIREGSSAFVYWDSIGLKN